VTDQAASVPAPQLLATCWTSAGNAGPMLGDEVSPVPLPQRVALIAEAGWAGIGLVHADLALASRTVGYDGLAAMIRQAGIQLVEVEFLGDWWTDGERRAASDRVRADLFEAAIALGARHIKVGAGLADHPIDRGAFTRAFADLAAEAARAGVRLAIEPAPFSYLPTMQAGADLVTDVDNPAAGLMIDTWHTYRSGMPYDRLWDVVPVEWVTAIELDDGAAEVVGSLFEDTINNRMYCGEGDFDTASFIRSATDAGYDGPWGVEIISTEHRGLPVPQGLRRAHDTAMACFTEALKAH
jgi:sugar phosphate isomerase/epimerase